MKKLTLLLASLALIGAGCGNQASTTTDIEADLEAGLNAPPTQQPPSGITTDVDADIDANLDGEDDEVEVPLTAAVNILAGGEFSPQAVTIKKGGKVTWTNTGTAKVWVASDPHPTHGGYAGFDSAAALAANESWSFTFDKAGTFTYHNHLNPSVKGTVVVTEL